MNKVRAPNATANVFNVIGVTNRLSARNPNIIRHGIFTAPLTTQLEVEFVYILFD